MNSFNFQIVPVANLLAIVTPFPDHICYFTEDTENYYIWENNALKEIFADTTSLTWNNITNKPTTISGFGITDAVKANNGTVNYVAKFTPDGTTIGNSFIQDDGSGVGLCNSPSTLGKISAISSDKDIVFWLQNPKIGGTNTSLFALTNGSSTTNTGVVGKAQNGTTSNYGVQGIAASAGLINYAISGEATGGLTNIGIRSYVEDGANNYVAWLQKAPESVQNSSGKFLKSITGDGKANWANINITEVTNGLSITLLGAPNGIATLDSNSKLVMSQMPISVMDYKGTYDIVTNTPNLVDGTGNQGDVYVCTTAGTRTFGTGNTLTVGVGDWLIYNGTKWEKTLGNNVGSGTVNSVGLSLGTTGTDVNVSNSPITTSGNINLNIPTASASARGLLSTADWTAFNNKVGGSGTLNYLPKWTPDGNTIGNSQIFDDGSRLHINSIINPNTLLNIKGKSSDFYTMTLEGGKANHITMQVSSTVAGTGGNTGIQSIASGSDLNIGLYGQATGTVAIGVRSYVYGTGSNYCFQGEDGSEAIGKFLKVVSTNGKANWANITAADVSGAVGAIGGTNNYVAKFTPNGTTIGNSQIQDDGTNISVNTTVDVLYKFKVYTDNNDYALGGYNSKTNGSGLVGYSNGSGQQTGTVGIANNSSATINIGVTGTALNGTIAIGIKGFASGLSSAKYGAQLQDGTEGVGKFLKSITGDGKANWAYLPDSAQVMCSDMTTSISANITLAKSFWIAPCDGLLVESFSNLYTAQAGGTAFTVTIKQNGVLISTMTFTNGASSSNTVTLNSATFTKGTLFEIFVTQVGDGTAKGLLTTINYLRS
jgi:hypothetical protein